MTCTDFPKLELPRDWKIWLLAAYEGLKAGEPIDPPQMLVQLWSEIPDFDYKAIDNRLMRYGVELTLIGILQIDPNTELCDQTDQVIRFIRDKIKKQPNIESITAEEVSNALEIPPNSVALIFLLMDHLGHFWNGASGHRKLPGYTSITIKDEYVKREYLKYECLESLLFRSVKTDPMASKEMPSQPEFVHPLLDFKLHERLDQGLNWISALPVNEVKRFNLEDLTRAVERFAIAVPVLAAQPVRDETIAELEDLTLERKTGTTGHIFLIPIDGDEECLQEINRQTAPTDSYPLAFLDKNRRWIYIKLTVSPNDPEGTLRKKLDQRLAIIHEYGTYVAQRVITFNKELAQKMIEYLNLRKEAILRGEAEAEAIGLATTPNPRHAETAIQIERLLQNLNARFMQGSTSSPTATDTLKSRKQMTDLYQDAVKIAKYLYRNNFIGSRSIFVSELRRVVEVSEESFDAADEYLLEAKISDGTAGGDMGQRWLTAKGVDFAKMNSSREGPTTVRDEREATDIDIFISHSSQDVAIAKALIILFRSALSVAANRIRCTSVDGYRLPAGAQTNDQLRKEVQQSRVFVGLISKASIESTFVMFELGARWGARLPLLPVVVNSSDISFLRGPLASLNALACDSRSQVHQLVEDVASHLGITPGKAASYQQDVDSLLATAGSKVNTDGKLNVLVDLDRMAKHVENYFVAKGIKKHVSFESIRKYVNANYSDRELFEMIDRFPERFRRVTLRGGKPAIAVVNGRYEIIYEKPRSDTDKHGSNP